MANFTPWSSLLGGVLIGVATSFFLLAAGRVAGVSSILGGVVAPVKGDAAWRVAFLAGLALAGLGMSLAYPAGFGTSPRSLAWLALAGALVGVGTQVGSGCTSGHGVCGLARFSPRSLVATLTFMATGFLTVTALRTLGLGGTP